ncbi:hypothetical protein BH23ACI1_BH23ACI1_29270 [soil metagenome]
MLLVTTLGFLPAHTPTPGGTSGPAVTAEPGASSVRIDAVVTDRSGRRVLDLRSADFDVKVNGEAQSLAGLEVRTPPRPRVFAFFLDEFHVSEGAATDRVRDALATFIDVHVRPADRVVLRKPLEPVTALRFSTDHAALREAAASFMGRKDDLTPRSVFEDQFIGRAPATVAAARAQIVTLALAELAVQLGELQAERAALVLVSEGFERGTQGLSRRQGRLPDLLGVVRAAGRFNFSIYALSPSDVEEGTPGRVTIEWLADQTGGISVVAAARLEAGLAHVAADMDAYYELRLPPPASDGRFHRVEVAARRAGLNVRARPGYWAPLTSEVQALLSAGRPPLPSGPRRTLRRSPMIDAWVGLRPAGPGTLAVVLAWIPARRAAGARPDQDPVLLDVTVRSEAGDLLFEGRIGQAGDGAAGGNVARFDAPAGRVEFDIQVLAGSGAVLDTEVRDAYVPRLSGPSIALLPPEVLRARTLPEYRRMLEDSAAVPTPLRSFARSDRLIVRMPVWQAGDGEIEASARVLNRRGQAMRSLEPLQAAADGIPAFDLPLAWLAPGEYYIEIAARQGDQVIGERILFRVTA